MAGFSELATGSSNDMHVTGRPGFFSRDMTLTYNNDFGHFQQPVRRVPKEGSFQMVHSI